MPSTKMFNHGDSEIVFLGQNNWRAFAEALTDRSKTTPLLRLRRSYIVHATKLTKHFTKDFSTVKFQGLEKFGVTAVGATATVFLRHGDMQVEYMVVGDDENGYTMTEARGEVEMFTDEEMALRCEEARRIDYYGDS